MQQRAQASGDVGHTEEVFGIAVCRWNARLAIGQEAKVEREDVLGEALGNDIGVKGNHLHPWPNAYCAHGYLFSAATVRLYAEANCRSSDTTIARIRESTILVSG
jgi:hypothetical protein